MGLVLVREPYFNEAGYEPLAGLDSSKRPSALYNERTFLRSSGFLISAVEAVKGNLKLAGIDGLRDEIRHLYIQPDGPKLLHAAVQKVEDVLKRSDTEEKVELLDNPFDDLLAVDQPESQAKGGGRTSSDSRTSVVSTSSGRHVVVGTLSSLSARGLVLMDLVSLAMRFECPVGAQSVLSRVAPFVQ